MKSFTDCSIFLGFCLLWICLSVSGKAVIPPNAQEEDQNKPILEVPDAPDAIKMKEGAGEGPEIHIDESKSEDKKKDNDQNDMMEKHGKHRDSKKAKEEEDDVPEEGDGPGEGDSESSHSYESLNGAKEKKLHFEAEPPEHWDGVRIERNGKINAEIEQELFLGPDHDEFESIPEEVGKEKLMEIFKLVDLDGDARLSMDELINWITLKTNEHFKEGVDGSKAVFPKVDTDGDGKLTWDEYTIQFLKQRGYSKKKIEKFKQGQQVLQEHDEEDNAIYKDRWQTADENEDEALSPEEFVSFMHPEHSERMLSIIVDEILHELDQNGDRKLSLAEFVSVPLSREEDLQKMEKEDEWIRGRREEYETRIDLNKDGIATLEELKAYMDPRNKQHAEGEARHLMGVADDNGDQLLSAKEVLNNYSVFIGSKVYNYARNVHDEF